VEGIYKTFDEFIRNTPFYTGAFKAVLFNRSENVMVNRWNDEVVYYIKKGIVKQEGAQKFFGYCKSSSVYVSIKYSYFSFKSVSFCPIIGFGHLNVVRFNRKIGIPIGGGKAMFSTPIVLAIVEDIPFERLYVLDFTTGAIFRLSYDLVKNKLKSGIKNCSNN
jgi:hypothetical protein